MKNLLGLICFCFVLFPISYSQKDSKPLMSYSDYQEKTRGVIYTTKVDELIERVEKYVATDDKYHLSIVQKNRSTGEMMLKGYYDDIELRPLWCIIYEMQKPRVEYSIIIKKDNENLFYEWTISQLIVSFNTQYGYNTDYISTDRLEEVHDELKIIRNNGSSFELDKYFFEYLSKLDNKIIEDTQQANDESLKRKDRKAAEYSLRYNTMEKKVYDGVLQCFDAFIWRFRLNAFR